MSSVLFDHLPGDEEAKELVERWKTQGGACFRHDYDRATDHRDPRVIHRVAEAVEGFTKGEIADDVECGPTEPIY